MRGSNGWFLFAAALAWAGIAAAAVSASREQQATAFTERFGGNVSELAPLKKQDRLALTDPGPRLVVTERVVIEQPVAVEQKPVAAKKPVEAKAQAERDVCTRHRMHKVSIRGGRSWRCRR